MMMFILQVEQLTSSYHSGGSLMVIAKNIERAKEIVLAYDEYTRPTEDEWAWADVYALHDDYDERDEKINVYPDAGCC